MKAIGAWPQIEATRVKPVLKMQVWDACSDAQITFNYDDLAENISWIVENDVLLASVYRQLETVKSVEIRYGARMESCSLMRDGADASTVQLSNGGRIKCELLVSTNKIFFVVFKSGRFGRRKNQGEHKKQKNPSCPVTDGARSVLQSSTLC